MVLTRQEKERLIKDLYDQGKTYQQIAVEARVSVRDIKPVLVKAEKGREQELGVATKESKQNTSNDSQQQKLCAASQAYRLFSEGKTPLEVTVELNIREKEATKYYREHWKLKGLYHLNQIYEDNKDDIAYILRLHRKMKVAGIGTEQAINLIKIASNDLPDVEGKYHGLKKEVDLLQSRKFRENRILHNLRTQIENSMRILKLLKIFCQEEESRISRLERERFQLKGLVKWFKHNDEECLKIEKIVRNEVGCVLSDGIGLLRIAFYSLMESMSKDPEKYSSLIYYAKNSSNSSIWHSKHYTGYFRNKKYSPQFNSFDFYFEALKSALLEDADRLYEQLLKEQTNKIVSDYVSYKRLL